LPTLDLKDQSLQLFRYPLREHDPLQPWDAADEYLLKRLQELGGPAANSLLVINDNWGALTAALHDRMPTTWNDSYLYRLALKHNLAQNRLDPGNISFVPGDRSPEGTFALVLLKIPKSLAFLEDLLLGLRPLLRPGARLLAGGMIKHTPARAYRLLADIIGPVQTSLAWKKARLADVAFTPEITVTRAGLSASEYQVEGIGWTLASRANVFSRERLDLGTALLLQHLPAGQRFFNLADLGCGNGVLALALAKLCPGAKVLGVDESYQAVASARDNARRVGLSGKEVTFAVADGLAEATPGGFDLIVCNPPFHQGRAIGDSTAWRMFTQAHRSLRKEGELRIVGNRHLGYHVKLKRLFGNCEVLGSDRKFVVLRAVR
jgi:16S rRNA (guanine1207-N2)-methyltransferase